MALLIGDVSMFTVDEIMSVDKNNLQEISKTLNKEDISQLVEWLSLKDDNVRYQAFLILQNRPLFANDVYPYWHIFRSKLQSDNSYQRSIGLMLIADNTKWDTENKISDKLISFNLMVFKETNRKPFIVK